MATITVDKFELLPGPPRADEPAAAATAGDGATSSPPLSRHELQRTLRLELSRLARVRAH